MAVQDNHCHLESWYGDAVPPEPVADALAAASAVGVDGVVQIGCDLDAARWTRELVDREPRVLGGVALHPTEATRLAATGELDAALEEVERLADHPRIRVVGETGLDHYWVPADDTAGRAAQRTSFAAHVALAKRLGKVVQVHDRDAHGEVLDLLVAEDAPPGTVLHCFSGDAAIARACVDRGYVLSFAGVLTFANAPGLRAALAAVPLDHVLVETDAPYLAPVPYRGRPNASYLVPLTVRAVAEVVGRDLAEVCATLAQTFQRVYGPF